MKQFVLASTNPGKIKDFQEIVRPYSIEIIPQSHFSVPEAEETGLTFIENALIKARHASALSGLPAIAEDSGLLVDALNGAPGLYSARYAKKNATAEENIQKLLAELASVPQSKRSARFYAVIVLLKGPEDPMPFMSEGIWEGEILATPRGQNGFGYLPIFYVPTHQCSGAEMSLEERNRINHRFQAFQKLNAHFLSHG